MLRVLFITAITIFITGCGDKDPFLKTYEKNKEYHDQLGKTESTELREGLANRAVFTATYLFTPTDDKNDTRDEKFIVNLYFNDEEVIYNEGDFNLTLLSKLPKKKKKSAKKKPKKKKKDLTEKEKEAEKNKIRFVKSVKKLDASDPLLKNISLVSEWSDYYLVTFPHIKKKRFYLVFDSVFYGKGDLRFSKVSKYVFTKEAF